MALFLTFAVESDERPTVATTTTTRRTAGDDDGKRTAGGDDGERTAGGNEAMVCTSNGWLDDGQMRWISEQRWTERMSLGWMDK